MGQLRQQSGYSSGRVWSSQLAGISAHTPQSFRVVQQRLDGGPQLLAHIRVIQADSSALVDKIIDSAGGSPALTTSLIADIPMTEFWQKEVRNLWQWTSQVVPSATVRPTE